MHASSYTTSLYAGGSADICKPEGGITKKGGLPIWKAAFSIFMMNLTSVLKEPL